MTLQTNITKLELHSFLSPLKEVRLLSFIYCLACWHMTDQAGTVKLNKDKLNYDELATLQEAENQQRH